MLADFEYFQNAVSNLSNDLQRVQLLSELKIAISALNKSQVQLVAHSLRLNDVFDCLNSSEKEQIELTCDVLTSLLSSLDLGFVLGQYSSSLLRALRHPSVKVKEMVIKELVNGTSSDDSVSRLCQEGELLTSVVDCIVHEDTSIANSAVQLLVKLGKTSIGLATVLSEPLFRGLKNAMGHNDVARYYVYELVVEMSIHSSEGLVACQDIGLMPSLVAELDSADVLLQLNAMELLTKLALSPHGFKFLERQGIIKAVMERMSTMTGDSMGSLLLPGLVKFFGNMAQSHPQEIFAQYPAAVTKLFKLVDNNDLVLRGVVLQTIGYVATTVQGKVVLDGLGESMPQTMTKLGIYISSLATEWRVQALNTVANLLQLKIIHQNPEALQITQAWFNHLSADPVELIMSVCKQPFPELRLAGLQVIQALADQHWGIQHVNNSPGLVEFLIDRTVEPSKLCKDAKYEIVVTITAAQGIEGILDQSTLERMREFVQQGPFYVRAQTEVAIEGAS